MIYTDENGNRYKGKHPSTSSLFRAVLEAVPVEHVYGGIVWEEVKERQVYRGEWVLLHNGRVYAYEANDLSSGTGMVVKPVRVNSDS